MRTRPDTLDLYLTQPAPCPYLKGQVEQKVITVLDDVTAPLAPLLTERGFRRSQHMFYRQQCPACRACIASRLVLKDFRPGEGLRRVVKKNAALSYAVTEPDASPENYDLFSRYLAARHQDGEMAKMSYGDFLPMMEEYPAGTRFLVCRDGPKTLGIMLFDEGPDGTSAVYSFFDPAEEKRSLGTWMILKLAEYTAGQGKPYLYLGFWVKGSPKMEYKARFQPLEIFVNEQWIAFTDAAPEKP
jgi:leucyl-tRNA---protein transferase